MTIDKFKNRIECINKTHAWLNEIVPKLRADIEKNGYRVKANGEELFQKDAERLEAIYRDGSDNRAWLDIKTYGNTTIYLRVSNSYKDSEFGASYYQATEWIVREDMTEYEPRKIYDVEKMRQEHRKALDMMEQARKLESDARSILYITEGR